MQIALSTLGCPSWDLETIFERGAAYGYDGVDFRGLGDTLDVTRHPRFTDRLAGTRDRLDAAGLTVSGLSSSIAICEAGDREENLAEARRLVPLARDLGVERIRVFGAGDPDSNSIENLARVGGETMREILRIDGADELQWLVETHDTWTASGDCATLLDELPADAGLVWDVAHTIRLAGESPAETLDAVGDQIEYVHLKDAVREPDDPDAMDDGWRYVLPGEGELPIDDAVAALRDAGYDGWLVSEHEKRWHRSLPEPETAFPAFVEWYESLA